MELLFGSFERTRITKRGYDESSYKFKNESTWDSVEYFRAVINSWYEYFPGDKNFIKQFKSCDDRQHQSAFFELFMFSLFRKLGYHVDYHTSVGKRKIDLKVSDHNDSDIYIDCTLSGEPNIDHSIQKIEHSIKEAIESIDSPLYYVIVDFECGRTNYPKVSNLIGKIKGKLRNLEDGSEEKQEFSCGNNGWYISIRFQKKSSPSDTTIGSYLSSQGGGFIDCPSYDILANTLNSKRGSKYKTETPFFIAVNSYNLILNKDIVKSVLYGDTNIEGFSNVRGKKAPFFYTNQPQNTSVTGVIMVHGLNAVNMDKVKIDIWYNPWTRYPLDNVFQEFNQFIPEVNRNRKLSNIRYSPGKDTYQLLRIEKDYFKP